MNSARDKLETTVSEAKPEDKSTGNTTSSSKTNLPRQAVKAMSIKDILEVLKLLKLEEYAQVFHDNSVDGEILTSLSFDDLVSELNMKKLEALRLHKYIETGHVPK